MKMFFHFVALLLILASSPSLACVVHGSDSGVCTKRYLPSSSELEALEDAKALWMQDLPFCGRFIASYFAPCVPSLPTKEWMAADANFPDGRPSSDLQVDVDAIRMKDKWIEETVTKTIQARIDTEREQGSRHYHYFRNRDCEEAYARYTCWLNFPRCDEFDESLPLCQSVCENLFRVCGFESDLWRCEEDVVDGEDDYNIQTFFPGQPFARNEFHPKSNDPMAVCTPSIKGASPPRHGSGVWSSVLTGAVSIVVSSWMLG